MIRNKKPEGPATAVIEASLKKLAEREAHLQDHPPKKDMVNLPEHYARYTIEPIRFIVENELDFCRANAVKYILRCDAKNGREDLDKARRYLDMFEKRFFDKDPDWWKAEGAPHG